MPMQRSLQAKQLAFPHQIGEEGGLKRLFHTLSEGSGRPSELGLPQVEKKWELSHEK